MIKKKNKDAFWTGILILVILFGGVIKLSNTHIAGVILTAYRVIIPLLTLHCIYRQFIRTPQEPLSRLFWGFAAMMVFWIAYGVLGLLLSDYSDLHRGLQEVVSLTYGLCSVFCISVYCRSKQCLDTAFKMLRISLIGLCLVAVFEILTGWHFSGSRLISMSTFGFTEDSRFFGLYENQIYQATGPFYNVNDFCALIGVLLPTLYIHHDVGFRQRLMRFLFFLLAAYILSVNDATIIYFACFVGMAIYWMLTYKNLIPKLCMATGLVAVQGGLELFLSNVLLELKKHLFIGGIHAISGQAASMSGQSGTVAMVSNVETAIHVQAANYQLGYGSLYQRINIYLDALTLTGETGGLGIGPAGFTPYFRTHIHRSNLVDPHNWWLEVLSQYGIFVFIAYLGMLICLFFRTIRLYKRTHEQHIAILIAMCTTFVIACISPSSFLGYAYQWLLPGLCIAALSVYGNKSGSGDDKGKNKYDI